MIYKKLCTCNKSQVLSLIIQNKFSNYKKLYTTSNKLHVHGFKSYEIQSNQSDLSLLTTFGENYTHFILINIDDTITCSFSSDILSLVSLLHKYITLKYLGPLHILLALKFFITGMIFSTCLKQNIYKKTSM